MHTRDGMGLPREMEQSLLRTQSPVALETMSSREHGRCLPDPSAHRTTGNPRPPLGGGPQNMAVANGCQRGLLRSHGRRAAVEPRRHRK